MCLILFALDSHERYDLIIAANRDEFYMRPTVPAHIWQDPAWMIAGKDLEGGGTWLGMDPHGKIAMLTNYRDLRNVKENAPTRGSLVRDFFSVKMGAADYLNQISPDSRIYNGFNLICHDHTGMHYFSNYGDVASRVGPGIHGLSNALLNDPWPKVKRGKAKLQELLADETLTAEALLDLLYDDKKAEDNALPETGVGLEWERQLSPMFIKSKDYGSRTSTVILRTRDGHVTLLERSYNIDSYAYSDRRFIFRIKHPQALAC